MQHFFVTISASSESGGRASVRVGPFGSRWSIDDWMNDFRGYASNLCWQADEIEEKEGSPSPSCGAIANELFAQLSAKRVVKA